MKNQKCDIFMSDKLTNQKLDCLKGKKTINAISKLKSNSYLMIFKIKSYD